MTTVRAELDQVIDLLHRRIVELAVLKGMGKEFIVLDPDRMSFREFLIADFKKSEILSIA